MPYITGGAPTSRDEVEGEYLPAFLGYYKQFPGYGFWAAIKKTTNDFLGWFHYPPAPGDPLDQPELGSGCAARLGERGTPPRVPVR
ncbi:hypothetical protein [Arthrobacter oryzae]|uniref:hypothetical protein n=1 Tax=Arthrobacter oryzae TaxID=409290 RepID=UPI00277F1DF8|nr:hypothetical protein [Arthrobacter oryzae]MDQ0078698.1 hypothetical protein [Arthrobacter oryzae]